MGQRTNGKIVMFLGVLVIAAALRAPESSWGLEVGDEAPDFTLPSTTGEKITLSSFRGKKMVLLEFYGADFSPV